MATTTTALFVWGLCAGAAMSIWVMRAFLTGTFYDPNPSIAATEIGCAFLGALTCTITAFIMALQEVTKHANTNG